MDLNGPLQKKNDGANFDREEKQEKHLTSSSLKLYIMEELGDSLLANEYFSSGRIMDSLSDCNIFNGAIM